MTGGHTMKATRFNGPTYCDHCGSMLWGLVGRQGLSCSGLAAHHTLNSYIIIRRPTQPPPTNTECKYVCHYGCADKVVKSCLDTTSQPAPLPGLPSPVRCWPIAQLTLVQLTDPPVATNRESIRL